MPFVSVGTSVDDLPTALLPLAVGGLEAGTASVLALLMAKQRLQASGSKARLPMREMIGDICKNARKQQNL